MSQAAIVMCKTGLVSSVGLSAPAACAAIRAGVANPTETRFVDATGEWVMAHQVPLPHPWIGRTRLMRMATMVIEECLAGIPRCDWTRIPLLLCVAEQERPGRLEGLDDVLFKEIQQELSAEFAASSAILAHGRISAGVALNHARRLLSSTAAPYVLVVATDSLLSWPTLRVYDAGDRLLTPANSNGFLPGEGAGAVLVGRPSGNAALSCLGIGFATEAAHVDSEQPLRGSGLAEALAAALSDAGLEMHDMDFRITDLAGESYYFKEATLALARLLRRRKEEFDIWHPAEFIGETGAVAGIAVLCVAEAAGRKKYAAGPNILAHMANDAGQRVGIVCRYGER